jgi:hypothetical protein
VCDTGPGAGGGVSVSPDAGTRPAHVALDSDSMPDFAKRSPYWPSGSPHHLRIPVQRVSNHRDEGKTKQTNGKLLTDGR